MMTKCVSPWYNCTGWLGVKHQFTYLLTTSPTHLATVFLWTPRRELLVLGECLYLQSTDSRTLLVWFRSLECCLLMDLALVFWSEMIRFKHTHTNTHHNFTMAIKYQESKNEESAVNWFSRQTKIKNVPTVNPSQKGGFLPHDVEHVLLDVPRLLGWWPVPSLGSLPGAAKCNSVAFQF